MELLCAGEQEDWQAVIALLMLTDLDWMLHETLTDTLSISKACHSITGRKFAVSGFTI